MLDITIRFFAGLGVLSIILMLLVFFTKIFLVVFLVAIIVAICVLLGGIVIDVLDEFFDL